MNRLFISLYVVIIAGIVLINLGSQALWQHLELGDDSHSQQLERLALTLAQSVDQHNQQRVAQALGAPILLLNPADIAWLAGQQKHLDDGQVIFSYDIDDRPSAYVLSHDAQQLIKLGPMPAEPETSLVKNSIIIGSYLVLALIIALWLRPLWRDLRNLQQASNHFSLGQQPPTITIGKTSVIAPVLNTFNRMTTQISRLIDEQKQMTNAVSHELRTPLARLKFSFAMLENQQLSQLRAMRDDVSELESLVDEMLDYGRLESQIKSLELSDVNLEQLLRNQVEKLSRNSDKSLNLSIDPHLTWLCDGHFIERACQNYITNALRYAATRVDISVTVEHNRLTISVEDDGTGIAQQDYAQVFKAFTRLDKSRNKQQGGFGLGLAIVNRIVDWHQGECGVEKSALGGAKFSMLLPRLNRDKTA